MDKVFGALFSCGFQKKRNASEEEIEESKAQRAERDAAEAALLKAKAEQSKRGEDVAAPSSKLSQDAEAVRSRERRAEAKRLKRAGAARASKRAAASNTTSAKDENKPAAKTPAEFENETHYVDDRGRKRKRKQTRTRTPSHGTVTTGGSRSWSTTERAFILATHNKINHIGQPDYSATAKELRLKDRGTYGPGAPGLPEGIQRQQVRSIVLAAIEGEGSDNRGRPPALTEKMNETIIAVLRAVIATRATLFSTSVLQPIALGVLMANDCAHLLTDARRSIRAGKKLKGLFCCSVTYILRLMKGQGWRNVRPQGDTRKLPENWSVLRWDFVLRLAYLVFVHIIPAALVINADHTGIMFTQHKGTMWIDDQAAKLKDKSVKGHGDKRQFTLLATTSAAGDTLKDQVVVSGKTCASLPTWADKVSKQTCSYSTTFAESPGKAKDTKNISVCFTMACLSCFVGVIGNVGSFCCTSNHWSDDVTSKAYVRDIADPYFKAKISELRASDPSACQEYGKQVCVLIVDCWWGWLCADFRNYVKQSYPYIRLLYVPACCTPVAQPMDAGVIAKRKGLLRTKYGRWACDLTANQLQSGVKPEEVQIPTGVPTMKKLLMEWLSSTVNIMNTNDKKGVIHCWENTKLLQAWDRKVQIEASQKASALFGDKTGITIELSEDNPDAASRQIEIDQSDDFEAGYLGKPLCEQEDPEEDWMAFVDWDACGGSSSDA